MNTRRQGAPALLPPGTVGVESAAGARTSRVTRPPRAVAHLAVVIALVGASLVALGVSVVGIGRATVAEADTIRRPLERLVGEGHEVGALGPRLRTDVHPTTTSTSTTLPAPPTERAFVDVAPGVSPLTHWPLGGGITGIYGEQRRSHVHAGLDIDGVTGDPVVSAGMGRVLAAGYLESYSGYGLTVVIDHGEIRTLSAHLSQVLVEPGDVVAPGQVIGLVGTTGNVTGSHLHFEVHHEGRFADPLDWLPARR